jgi:hypothetical protein
MRNAIGLIAGLFLVLVESILIWPLLALLVMGCFVVFDVLHIQSLELQIATVVAPFALAAFLMWRRQTTY